VDKDKGISLNGQKLENVLKEYIDTRDQTTLDTAKEYTEEKIVAEIGILAKSVDGLTVDGNQRPRLEGRGMLFS
jgi:hypothetical protein